MKRILFAFLLSIILLWFPVASFANGLGISPSSAELIVPKDGSATCDFTVYGLDGTVNIDLEDIPLLISPASVDVSDGETITITIYGDGSNNIYEGKIRFVALVGEQVAAGIKVHLTVHVNCNTEVINPLPPIIGGGGGDGIVYGIKTNLFGTKKTYYTGYDGGTSKSIEAISGDGNLSVTISKHTAIRDENGRKVKDLEILVNENPPEPPSDTSIIGLPYTFEPNGTTFDPPMTLAWKYDDLPEDIIESDLVLAFYDMDTGEWVSLDCVVDVENKVITATVSHFTTFAILATLPEALPIIPVPVTPVPSVVPLPAPVSPVPDTEPPPVEITTTPPVEISPQPLPDELPAAPSPSLIPLPVEPERPISPYYPVIIMVSIIIFVGMLAIVWMEWQSRKREKNPRRVE